MKKAFWAVLALAVGAYFVYSASTAKNEKLERERSEIAETKSIQNAVLSMVQRNGAIDDWDTQLAEGDTIKIGPVMTIDLERLWLQDKPILFAGAISDIKTYDSQNYTVTLDRNLMATVMFSGVELRLELKADKKLIDAFIEQWPQVTSEDTIGNGVAVIAKIASIRSAVVSTDHTAIGEGQLLDLAYAGMVPF